MFGKKMYVTVVRGIDNRYILGRIVGILTTVSGRKRKYKNVCMFEDVGKKDTTFIVVECTTRQYNKAWKIIETVYPQMCEFDAKVLIEGS